MGKVATRELESGHSGGARAGELTLGSLPHSLGFKLRRLQLAYKKHFVRLAAGTGFQPAHVGPMSLIARNPGVTPSALAAALTVDAAQVTGVIKELELRGLVSRRTSPSDNRSRSLRLTALGKRQYERLKTIIAEVESSFVGAALSPQEIVELGGLLERLRAAPHNQND